MTVSFALFTFVNAWWILLFAVLPFYTVPSQNPTSLEYPAAPKKMPWKKVLLANTLLSAAVTALIALIMASGLIPMRDVVM